MGVMYVYGAVSESHCDRERQREKESERQQGKVRCTQLYNEAMVQNTKQNRDLLCKKIQMIMKLWWGKYSIYIVHIKSYIQCACRVCITPRVLFVETAKCGV